MNERKLPYGFLFLLLFFMAAPSQWVAAQSQSAQPKLKVIVNRTDNEKELPQQEITAEKGMPIEQLLRENGLLKEFGTLQPDEVFEIIIRRRKKGVVDQQTVALDPVEDETGTGEAAPAYTNSQRSTKSNAETGLPFLGVYFENVTTANAKMLGIQYREGSYVKEVISKTPAEYKGIEVGDIIVGINKNHVNSNADLSDVMSYLEAGQEVVVHFIRKGMLLHQRMELANSKTFGKHYAQGDIEIINPKLIRRQYTRNENEKDPEDKALKKRGWSQEAITDYKEDKAEELANVQFTTTESLNEVVVQNLNEDSPLRKIGLKQGDLIAEINYEPIIGREKVQEAIDKTEDGSYLRVVWLRNGEMMSGKTRIGQASNPQQYASRSGRQQNSYKAQPVYVNKQTDKKVPSNTTKYTLNNNTTMMLPSMYQRPRPEKIEPKLGEMTLSLVIFMEDVNARDQALIRGASQGGTTSSQTFEIESLNFFPNPTEGMFNLMFSLPDHLPVQIRILDARGKEIYHENIADFSGNYHGMVDLRDYTKGVYFIQLFQRQNAFSKKIIIQ